MDYVKLAAKKYLSKKESKEKKIDDNNQFLGMCYYEKAPSEYGKLIQKRYEKYFGLKKVSEKNERGDSMFSTTNNNEIWFEIKASFLGINNCFSIRHIRPWQKFDYYLMCFIHPCNCEPEFYVVTCNDLINNFNLSYMNGTKKSNENNDKVSYGINININSSKYELLKMLNKCEGNTGLHVFEFLAKQNLN